MKTTKKLMLIILSIWSFSTQAQILCGITQPYYYSSPNPNNVPVFHDTSSYASGWQPVSYFWDFGDGGTSTLASPSHVFGPGNFNVCMTVTAQLQGTTTTCSQTYCKTYSNCNGMVTSAFTTTQQGAGVVNFVGTGSSNYPPVSFVWDFGDGSTGAGASLSHTYTSNGSYTACLQVSDTNGCSSTTCHTIMVTSALCGANANFTASNTSQGVVVLSSTSTGTNTNTLYQWWVDGNAVNNPNSNTSYTITGVSTGYHTYCLYVYANANTFCDSICQTVYVQNGVNSCGSVAASFVASTGNGLLTVSSNSTGVPSGAFYQWYLGGTATGLSPGNSSYTWNNLPSGVYTVCLYIWSSSQQWCDSTCQTISINNSNPCAGLTSAWTVLQQQGNVYSLSSANNTIGGVVHIWTVNGTPVATSQNLTYQFPSSSSTITYNVCHKVQVPGSICVDSTCQAIAVTGSGTACSGVSATITQSVTPSGTVLTAVYNGGNPTSYLWSTGATSSSIITNVFGAYCVTVIDANGCSAVACDSSSGNGCIAQFAGTALNCNQVLFDDYSTGNYNSVIWYYGDGSTDTTAPQSAVTHTYANGGVWTVMIELVGGTCDGTTGYYVVYPQACYTDTICGTIFNDVNGNGVQDGNETGLPYGYITAGNYTAYVDSFGHYTINLPAGTYNIYYCAPTGYTYTIPVTPTTNSGISTCTAYANVTISGGGLHCGYDFGIQNTSVNICGTIYFDANNNGTQDAATENGISGVHVYITGSNGTVHHAYTDAQGHYCVTLPAGTYTVTITSTTFQSCVSAPATLSVAATAIGTSYYNNNFAIYCQPGSCNLAINITPHTTVTAGFPAWYDIQVCNLGSGVSSGTVNLFYDNALTFDYASPAQTSHNASTHTVSWALNNLLPGDCEYYWVNFDALTNIQLNQFVFTLANVAPSSGCNDVNMNNNVDTIHQAVTSSWDPNNKLAYVTNYESNPAYQQVSSINANQRIEYVVNFQNTGNSPAVNVVVLDELSADIDENSFEFLGGSHACNVTRDGKKLNFKFTNIMLADSTNNEPQSHGFVKFAVNAVNGLPGGHVISDDAAIYFDYNAAVLTNDAAVILLDASGMEEVVVSTTVVIAPNPMSKTAEIRLQGSTSPFTFRVTDMSGRLVSETRSEGTSLLFERNSLSAGMYTYQILQNNKPAANGKLVIQ